jgi:hypothetical protein
VPERQARHPRESAVADLASFTAPTKPACSGESPAIICMRGGRSAKMICVVTSQMIYPQPAVASIMDTSQVDQHRCIEVRSLHRSL